jgi:hypothetical protein
VEAGLLPDLEAHYFWAAKLKQGKSNPNTSHRLFESGTALNTPNKADAIPSVFIGRANTSRGSKNAFYRHKSPFKPPFPSTSGKA